MADVPSACPHIYCTGNVGLLATFLWVSAGEMSVLFLLVPTVVAVLVGWVVWLVADSFARRPS